MHILIVTFQLKDLSEEDYAKACDQVAPAFAAVPGLISKVFLADPATNTYGGVLTWRDRPSMEAFMQTELFEATATDPNLTGITARDFGVLEGPTRVTRGLMELAV